MITMLHVIEGLQRYGGTPKKLLYLARHIDRTKARLAFACFLPSQLEDEFRRFDSTIVTLNTLSPIKLIRNICSLARENKANVICTHFTRPLITGFFAARLCRIPIIHNEHSSAHYRRGISRSLARWMLPRVNQIVCNSAYTFASIRDTYPTASAKLCVIHNPVEARSISRNRTLVRKELHVQDQEILIGHTGGMIAERDQATLLKALHQVHKRYRHVKLVFIGDGGERGKLEAMARAIGLGNHVLFLGYTDKVGDYLSAFDIYVNPTLDEGFGIAVVEAMLAKLPVVLSDRGAHPELIVDGISGLLYCGGDANNLAMKLDGLIQDVERRNELATAGCELAQKHFLPSKYAIEYLHIVQTVLEEWRTS